MPDDVIMIPGLGSDAAVWQPTIAELPANVHCTVGDTLSDFSLASMADRILKTAPERFALAGVSMGGMVALEIMRASPERVTRVALFDTNARPDTAQETARRRWVNEAMLKTTDLGALAAPGISSMLHPKASQNVSTALRDMIVRVGADTYVRQNKAIAERDNHWPVLATIKVPTLVVVGSDDLITPVILSKEIAVGIIGAKLHMIADCGHLPPIEKPAIVAGLLRDWLGH